MEIAYLSASRIPSRAANSIHVMKMCSAMAGLGHRVVLYADWDGDRGVFGHYGVRPDFGIVDSRLPLLRKPVVAGFAIAVRARLQGARLAWGRNLAGCWAASRLGLKVVFETHDDSSALNERGRRMVDHLFASPAVTRVVVISETLARIYASRYPANAGKILVAHDGADPVEPRREWTLDAPPAAFKAGYIGHLYPGRGIEVIVALAERCPWAGFFVLGGAPEDVERWRTSTRILPNLHFTGFLPPARVEAARSSFDVLLAPYQRKVAVSGGSGDTSAWMSPLKIFEYMSSGSPIIASDLPALREILEPGRTALLCPPEEIGAWETALTRLRDNPALRSSLAGAARETFLREYTWKARAERVIDAAG